jgi:hypothetical protein
MTKLPSNTEILSDLTDFYAGHVQAGKTDMVSLGRRTDLYFNELVEAGAPQTDSVLEGIAGIAYLVALGITEKEIEFVRSDS